MMTGQEAKSLAEAHWAWLESQLHKAYVDAFVHGVKHGQQDVLEQNKRQEGWDGVSEYINADPTETGQEWVCGLSCGSRVQNSAWCQSQHNCPEGVPIEARAAC